MVTTGITEKSLFLTWLFCFNLNCHEFLVPKFSYSERKTFCSVVNHGINILNRYATKFDNLKGYFAPISNTFKFFEREENQCQ